MYKKTIENLRNFLGVLFLTVIGLVVLDKLGFGFGLDILLFIKIALFLALFLLVLTALGGIEALERAKREFFEEVTDYKIIIFRFFNKKWVSWVLIPAWLFLLGMSLSFINIFNAEESFSILGQNHKTTSLTYWNTDEILAAEKIVGGFTASEDNLGIVAVRFKTFERINDDYLIFRIKEVGQDGWHYEHNYKTDQFRPDELFPFGFPKIENSKNRLYQFEIESIQGSPGNAVAVSSQFPVIKTKYEFNQAELLANKKYIVNICGKKFLKKINSYT